MDQAQTINTHEMRLAELAFARELHALLLHEVGNPLQSLGLLVELSHDELCESGPAPASPRSVARLGKALRALEELRSTLHTLEGLRASLDDLEGGSPASWREFLDALGHFIEPRLLRLGAGLDRRSAAIDGAAMPAGAIRSAIAAAAIALCEQLRGQRGRGPSWRLTLSGTSGRGRVNLRISLAGAHGPLRLAPASLERVAALAGTGLELDAEGGLTLWAPLA